MLTHFTLTQPLALDNALYTGQIIHKLITQMNKVIDEVNSIDSKANEYTDREIVKLHIQINDQLQQLEQLLQSQIDVNTLDITELKNRADNIQSELERIENKLDQFITDTTNEFVEVRNEINTVYHSLIAQMVELRNYVEELIKKMTVKVYSNYDGCKKDIKDALNDVYNYNRRVVGSSVSFGRLKEFLNALISISAPQPPISGDVKGVLTFGNIKRMIGATGSSVSYNGIMNTVWFSTKIVQYQTASPQYDDASNFKDIMPVKTPTFLDIKLYGFILWLCMLQSEVTYLFAHGQPATTTSIRQCATATIKALWTALGLGNEEILPITARGWSYKL